MAKTPGEHAPLKLISKEEREARKAFRQVEAEMAMTDHESAQKAFNENRERLKAERPAREATEQPASEKKPKNPTKKK
jgi:hypothetical protein